MKVLKKGVDVFTTGDVSRMCGCAPRTASKWCDSGVLKSHKMPGGQDRRIYRKELIEFMRKYGMDTSTVPGGSGGGRILAVGVSDRVAEMLSAVAVNGDPVEVTLHTDDLVAWSCFVERPHDVVVLGTAFFSTSKAVKFAQMVRSHSESCHIVGVVSEYDSAEDIEQLSQACNTIAPFPHTPEQIRAAVAGWRDKPIKFARSGQLKRKAKQIA